MLTNRLRTAVLITILALPGIVAVPVAGADDPPKVSTRPTADQPEVTGPSS
jgi:hypothetical protein